MKISDLFAVWKKENHLCASCAEQHLFLHQDFHSNRSILVLCCSRCDLWTFSAPERLINLITGTMLKIETHWMVAISIAT